MAHWGKWWQFNSIAKISKWVEIDDFMIGISIDLIIIFNSVFCLLFESEATNDHQIVHYYPSVYELWMFMGVLLYGKKLTYEYSLFSNLHTNLITIYYLHAIIILAVNFILWFLGLKMDVLSTPIVGSFFEFMKLFIPIFVPSSEYLP